MFIIQDIYAIHPCIIYYFKLLSVPGKILEEQLTRFVQITFV